MHELTDDCGIELTSQMCRSFQGNKCYFQRCSDKSRWTKCSKLYTLFYLQQDLNDFYLHRLLETWNYNMITNMSDVCSLLIGFVFTRHFHFFLFTEPEAATTRLEYTPITSQSSFKPQDHLTQPRLLTKCWFNWWEFKQKEFLMFIWSVSSCVINKNTFK